MTPPPARRDDVVDDYFGVSVPDPYRWLEDPDSPETRAFVEAQNQAVAAFLADRPEREAIRRRLTALWDHPRVGLPVKAGTSWFFTKNDGLANQAVLCVTDDLDGPERILLDPNTLSADGTTSLSSWSASDDGRWLVWGASAGGSDWVTWRVRDVATGQDLPDEVRWSKFSGAAWRPDGSGFFYGRYDEPTAGTSALQAQRLCWHTRGTSQDDDVVVVSRPDHPEWGFIPWVSDDGRWLVVSVWKGSQPEVQLWVADLTASDLKFREIVPTFEAAIHPFALVGDVLYASTDLGAPNHRVVTFDLASDAPVPVELVPEQEHVLLGASYVGGRLFLQYLEHAQTVVRLCRPDGTPDGALNLGDPGTAGGFAGRPDDTDTFFYTTRFTAPTTVHRLDVATLRATPFRPPHLPFQPDDFVTEQVFATSKDGTRVPMFLSRRRDVTPTGDVPTILYGYGGFDIPVTPAFSVLHLVYMEMGGMVATCNLRGGGEYGRRWHEAGTLARKQNVFDDFFACGEHVAQSGWTRPGRIASKGKSNGGLLVGATLVQRPWAFGAALPGVGVHDMLRYHRFTIGWAWSGDYGRSDDAEMFPHLLAYSPVHNARPADYPPVLVTTGDHDDRVVPAHSYKLAAALQHAQRGPAPVLCRVETRAGHGAGKSTSMLIDEAVDELDFLSRVFTMPAPP